MGPYEKINKIPTRRCGENWCWHLRCATAWEFSLSQKWLLWEFSHLWIKLKTYSWSRLQFFERTTDKNSNRLGKSLGNSAWTRWMHTKLSSHFVDWYSTVETFFLLLKDCFTFWRIACPNFAYENYTYIFIYGDTTTLKYRAISSKQFIFPQNSYF